MQSGQYPRRKDSHPPFENDSGDVCGMLELKNIRFSYPGTPKPVLEGFSATLKPGELVALMGANGSGKSTLARLISGLAVPDSGEICIDGACWDEGPSTLNNRVGLVRQDPRDQLIAALVEEEVAFGPENLGLTRPEIEQRVEQALITLGLEGERHRTPDSLSVGQQQRLAVAGILAMAPEYLIFDESASMLDPRGRISFFRLCRELAAEGYGVLTITHFADEACLADRLLILQEGRVADEGAPLDLLPHHPELGRPFRLALHQALKERGIILPPGSVAAEAEEYARLLAAELSGPTGGVRNTGAGESPG